MSKGPMRFAVLASLGGFAIVAPAKAQNPAAPGDRTAALIAKANKLLADAGVSAGCQTLSQTDEILVCGHGIDQRIKTIPPPDKNGPKQVRLAAPPIGKGVGVGVAVTGCFLQKCPGPPVYYVDVSKLPEAPAGSDADLIARGEMPDR